MRSWSEGSLTSNVIRDGSHCRDAFGGTHCDVLLVDRHDVSAERDRPVDCRHRDVLFDDLRVELQFLQPGGRFIVAVMVATPASPCALVASAEVRVAFGGTVGAGRIDNSLPGAPSCHFTVKKSNLGLDGEAVVFITPEQSAATFKLAKKEVPGAVSVSGVGTAAFYNPHTSAIELLKGKAVASAQAVFLNPGGAQPNPTKLKADVVVLARAVAKHL